MAHETPSPPPASHAKHQSDEVKDQKDLPVREHHTSRRGRDRSPGPTDRDRRRRDGYDDSEKRRHAARRSDDEQDRHSRPHRRRSRSRNRSRSLEKVDKTELDTLRADKETTHSQRRGGSRTRPRSPSMDRRRRDDRPRDSPRDRKPREPSPSRKRDRSRSRDAYRSRNHRQTRHRSRSHSRHHSRDLSRDRDRERHRHIARDRSRSRHLSVDRHSRRSVSPAPSRLSHKKHKNKRRSRSPSPPRHHRRHPRSPTPNKSKRRRHDSGSPSPSPRHRSRQPLPSQEVSFRGLDNSKLPPTKYGGAPPDKELPNFAPTGLLAKEANTVAGTKIALKYHEPPEARKPSPSQEWRIFIFKGSEALGTVDLYTRSCWLLGRAAEIADVVLAHPSCSSQHAAIQFRYIVKKEQLEDEYGLRTEKVRGKVKPYVIDLESSNGTMLNGERIEAGRYFELRDKDLLQFGGSEREYVVMLPPPEK